MHKRGAKHILAVDVGSRDMDDLHNYGDWLSGWPILLAKLNPFSSVPRVLSQADIQVRLAYVSCVRQLEEVRNADYCDYIRPPIDKYGTLQFDAYDEIREVGIIILSPCIYVTMSLYYRWDTTTARLTSLG